MHLDHDLGGEIYVDSGRPDCGMEVVRWLAAEPRAHIAQAMFIIHTHNATAAKSMLQSLLDHGYQAVYRPFGVDLFDFLTEDDADENAADDLLQAPPTRPHGSWIERLRQLSRRFLTSRRD